MIHLEAVILAIGNVLHTGARLPDGRLLYAPQAIGGGIATFSSERAMRLLHPGARIAPVAGAQETLNGKRGSVILLEPVALQFSSRIYAGAQLPDGRLIYALTGRLATWRSEEILHLIDPTARVIRSPVGDGALNCSAPLFLVTVA